MKIGEYKTIKLYCGDSRKYNMVTDAYFPVKCYISISYKRITDNLYHASFVDERDETVGNIHLSAQDEMSLFFKHYKKFKVKQFNEINHGHKPDGGHIYDEISCYFVSKRR